MKRILTFALTFAAIVMTFSGLELRRYFATPVEKPAEACENAQIPHGLVKRLNYTTLFANAPRTRPAPQIPEVINEVIDEAAEPIPEVRFKMLATAYSSDPAENGEWGAVDCRYGRPLPEDAIAANLSQLPYGTRVYIEGFGERVVVDTASQKTISRREAEAETKGAAGWIDIYYGDDKQGALKWGVQIVEVTVLEWGDVK